VGEREREKKKKKKKKKELREIDSEWLGRALGGLDMKGRNGAVASG